MPVTERTYELVALEDPERKWELHHGRLREKPAMTVSHNQFGMYLAYFLLNQLDWNAFTVRADSARAKRSDETYYIPDVVVIPTRLANPLLGREDILEVYEEPLPFVAEIWSRSTGDYDVDQKLPEYMKRGDQEIWRVHPYERTVTVWRRQPNGSYRETVFRGGTIVLHALPHVTIDLDRLWALT